MSDPHKDDRYSETQRPKGVKPLEKLQQGDAEAMADGGPQNVIV